MHYFSGTTTSMITIRIFYRTRSERVCVWLRAAAKESESRLASQRVIAVSPRNGASYHLYVQVTGTRTSLGLFDSDSDSDSHFSRVNWLTLTLKLTSSSQLWLWLSNLQSQVVDSDSDSRVKRVDSGVKESWPRSCVVDCILVTRVSYVCTSHTTCKHKYCTATAGSALTQNPRIENMRMYLFYSACLHSIYMIHSCLCALCRFLVGVGTFYLLLLHSITSLHSLPFRFFPSLQLH